MPTERADRTASIHLETTSTREQQPPPWFAELAVLAHWFRLRWVLIPLCAILRLRRRVDATAAVDVLLVMLAALVGNCPLAHAREALAPVRSAVPALWDRGKLASRSAVSRFLAALDARTLDARQTLFYPRSASSASRARPRAA